MHNLKADTDCLPVDRSTPPTLLAASPPSLGSWTSHGPSVPGIAIVVHGSRIVAISVISVCLIALMSAIALIPPGIPVF